ncbi:MAG TPA: tetraacyldisaccharide 4'-kinase [Prolixibacteraceae bacterium]|nr:tetraacyldisaccharide 4'-kinase [Prolixibacteraceae bacterium]
MLKILLYPFMLIYALVVSIRNFMFDSKIFKQHEFNVPIISVGNITVGGTGKTPHAEYLITILKKQFKVAYLSRGYRRKTKGFVLATKQSGVKEIGDEPVQIKQKFPDITVAVCEKRVKGIHQLLEDKTKNHEVIVLDDAFQHRSVKPSINILLIDYTQQIFDDQLLPVGKLRESCSGRYRANFIIFTKCPPMLKPIEQRIIKNKLNIRPYQNLFFTSIVYGEITPAEKGLKLFSNDMRKHTVLLITGIANPQPLVDYLTPQVGEITHLNYPDHFHYSETEINLIHEKYEAINVSEKLMITTEKDLVRFKSISNLPDHFFEKLYYIPIEIKFLDRTKELFNQRIINHVTENNSNSKFH